MNATRRPRAARSTRTSARAFWRRFGRLEHEQLEFKQSAGRLQESVVAMAMASGGVIVVGVSDDRRVVGCAHDQATLDRVALVAHETQVDLETETVVVAGTPVVVVHVPQVRDRIVTTPDGRILRRLGSANQPVRGDAVSRLVRARATTSPA
jgi:ATP-dependent DNA helicase RecG